MPPIKKKNKEIRPREFLTPNEVDNLIDASKKLGRHGHRDATILLMCYRHGMRVSEIISLKWQNIDLTSGLMQGHCCSLICEINLPDFRVRKQFSNLKADLQN